MRLLVQVLLAQGLLIATRKGYALDEWTEYKQKFNKTYNIAEVDMARRLTFEQVRADIEKFNADRGKRLGYQRGLNEMSDWNASEFKQLGGYQLSSISSRSSKMFEKIALKVLPKNFDWRKYSKVSPVQMQGKSNSSFAFAAVGAFERLSASRSKDFSEQCVVDCISGFTPSVQGALSWIRKEGGQIPLEREYPYYGERDLCLKGPRAKNVTGKDFMIIEQSYDEETLKNMIYQFGPVAVAMGLDIGFLAYKKGIFVCEPSEFAAKFGYQAVLLIGYGTDARGVEFWIVKNSLGPTWGEAGFARIKMRKENSCDFRDITGVIPLYPASTKPPDPAPTSTTEAPSTSTRPPPPPPPTRWKKKLKGRILSKFYFSKPRL